MSRETRLVRPYEIAPGLSGVLDEVVLRYGRVPIPAGSTTVWPAHEPFGQQRVLLAWRGDDASFDRFRSGLRSSLAQMGIPKESVGLLVTARTAYLQRTETLLHCSLGDLDSLERVADLTSPRRPIAFRTLLTKSVRVEVHLLLASAVPKDSGRPLRPWRKGTWLAHTRFRLRSEAVVAFFQPIPLTPAKRRELGLGAGVVRFLDLQHCEFLEDHDPDNQPTLYLDHTVLKRLAANPRTPAATCYQTDLAAWLLTGLLAQASSESEMWQDDAWSDLRETLLGRLVAAVIGRRGPQARERLLEDLRRGRLERVAAAAEDSVQLKDAVRKALTSAT